MYHFDSILNFFWNFPRRDVNRGNIISDFPNLANCLCDKSIGHFWLFFSAFGCQAWNWVGWMVSWWFYVYNGYYDFPNIFGIRAIPKNVGMWKMFTKLGGDSGLRLKWIPSSTPLIHYQYKLVGFDLSANIWTQVYHMNRGGWWYPFQSQPR